MLPIMCIILYYFSFYRLWFQIHDNFGHIFSINNEKTTVTFKIFISHSLMFYIESNFLSRIQELELKNCFYNQYNKYNPGLFSFL